MHYRPSHTAFTLIETVAVVVIVGLLATAAMTIYSRHDRSVELEAAMERLGTIDQFARRMAKRHGERVELYFELRSSLVRVIDPAAEASEELMMALPSGYIVQQVTQNDRRTNHDAHTIAYSSLGIAPTFGVTMIDPKGKSHHLAIAGLTGQIKEMPNEHSVDRLFVQVARHHTR